MSVTGAIGKNAVERSAVFERHGLCAQGRLYARFFQCAAQDFRVVTQLQIVPQRLTLLSERLLQESNKASLGVRLTPQVLK